MTLAEVRRLDRVYHAHAALGPLHHQAAERAFEHWREAATDYINERRAERALLETKHDLSNQR